MIRVWLILLLGLPSLAEARPSEGPLTPDLDTQTGWPQELPVFAMADGRLGNHRLELVDEEVFLDPATGVLTATVSITVEAGFGGFESVLVLVDPGLIFDRAWSDQGELQFQQTTVTSFAFAQIFWPQVAAEGERVTLNISYAGVLQCVGACDTGGERVDFITARNGFAEVLDPISSRTTPYYRRDLRLSVPSGTGVYVAAEELSRVDDGERHTVETTIPVRHNLFTYVAIFGDFVERPLDGLSVPTYLLHLRSDEDWLDEFETWTARILPFLDAQAGRAFPYGRLNLVKLPQDARLRGTIGATMTLLSDFYATVNPRYFEETLAHEISHLWWAVFANDEHLNTRFLSEGLAAFTQIDYAARVLFPDRSYEEYMGLRYREIESVFRYSIAFAELPPVVPPVGVGAPARFTEWAYLKGAAVLELLRLSIGPDAFSAGLIDYLDRCFNVPCQTDDFQAAMSEAANEDLSWFFDQYVYESNVASFTVDYSQTQTDEGFAVDVRVEPQDELTNRVTLWWELENEQILTDTFVVEGAPVTRTATVPARVRAVRPDPRGAPLLRFDTPVAMDANFDVELDGLDLIHCARLLGLTAFNPQQTIDEGILTGNLRFDGRCDVNGNAQIERADLDAMLEAFPQVRP